MNYKIQRDVLFGLIHQVAMGVLNPLVGQLVDKATLNLADSFLKAEFQKLQETCASMAVQPGLRICGIKAVYDPVDSTKILYQLEYGFDPAPRYEGQAGEVIPLGHHEEYDLYVGLQVGLPATLLARYGNKGPFYSSLNPHLVEIDPNNTDHEPFVEAYVRACELNLMKLNPVQEKGYMGSLLRTS
jgi:hypothetical protein